LAIRVDIEDREVLAENFFAGVAFDPGGAFVSTQ